MKRVLFGPLLRLVYRPWIRGARHVPTTGAAILASNHQAVVDSFFLAVMLDRQLVFIGKQEYFTGSGIKGRLVSGFMRGVGTIPVDRSGGRAGEAALATGLRRLREGGLFGIYPEGTRSPDGTPKEGKTGAAMVARKAKADILPCSIYHEGKLKFRRKITVRFGEIIPFADLGLGETPNKRQNREATDKIMAAITKLWEMKHD